MYIVVVVVVLVVVVVVISVTATTTYWSCCLHSAMFNITDIHTIGQSSDLCCYKTWEMTY